MRRFPTLVATGLAGALLAGPGLAQVTVIGNGLAASCSQYAFRPQESRQALRVCDLALETEAMLPRDAAATLVNRGILHMRQKSFVKAGADFTAAERIQPQMPEIYLNRGALLIRQGQFQEAVRQIDLGLTLNPDEPEKGYYNRALAKEQLEDFAGAYRDLQRALELKPDWTLPQTELARYSVSERGS